MPFTSPLSEYFVVHQPQAVLPIQNGGATPALYAWAFLAIAVLGADPWSLDALIARRRDTPGVTTPESRLARRRARLSGPRTPGPRTRRAGRRCPRRPPS
ncbi:hypothetical protein Aau02nite_26870 [Amorphoplanes auranticolor]|uniref:Uncharacterized protein n=1 Tax=Actinoplanes auranticolor TaxID=47988 RepID=A0A919VIQ0_9ACTN|nr:hypothetical protein Aau02nite_26870 [Actinoplanes auranticolor]